MDRIIKLCLEDKRFLLSFFEFSLRNPSSKRTLSCTIAEFGYYQIKEKARWCPYTPTPKSFVKTLEGMNMKFKFIFYLSNDFYNIYSPLESFQSNYYEQESFFEENIFDEENSTVEITEDTNLEIFEKQLYSFFRHQYQIGPFPFFISLEDKSKYTIECANFYKSLSKTYF